jgi:hypothetical protein
MVGTVPVDESSRMPLERRVVGALQRAPYLTAFIASVALLSMWDSGRRVFDQQGTRSWLDWIVLGYTAYDAVVSLIVVPRVMAPQFQRKGLSDRLFPLRLAFAVAPALVGFALSGTGADGWVSTLTLAVSIALLFIAARATATTRTPPTV